MSTLRHQMRYLNPYDLHKLLINEYVLQRPGDTKLLQGDRSKDRNDLDVLRDNHRFLWDDSSTEPSWEQKFAKKYYDKLFKEYCIGDLTLYKDKKIALRWRVEQEVVTGKGQFICGDKKCKEKDHLRTWEVNFKYQEGGVFKNALVKIRLCKGCSKKLNYHTKKPEVKRLNNKKNDELVLQVTEAGPSTSISTSQRPENKLDKSEEKQSDAEEWLNHKPEETKTRDEEMEDYLNTLLL